MSLQQIDYKRLAAEVYGLMKHDQDEEEEKPEEEELSEEEKKKKAEEEAKRKAEEEKKEEDSVEEMKGSPATLQFSPEQAGVNPTDPTITPPEDAERMCVEAKIAKGIDPGQAQSECAQERADNGPQTAPEDAKPVLSLESMNQRIARVTRAVVQLMGKDEGEMSCVDQKMADGMSEEEAKAACAPEGDSKAQDSQRKLINFLVEKSHGAFTHDALKVKSLCELRALDTLLDTVYKKSKDQVTGRPQRFPQVDSSQVQKVEFKHVTVGKRNKDTDDWEPIV